MMNLDHLRIVPPKAWLDESREPPEYVVEALADSHPFVKLAWEPALGRWGLYEQVGNHHEFISALAGPAGEFEFPHIGNTVHFLWLSMHRNLHSKHSRDEFLDQVVDAGENDHRKNVMHEVSEKTRDVAGVIYDSALNKVVIPRG